jgi:hypothetical protein
MDQASTAGSVAAAVAPAPVPAVAAAVRAVSDSAAVSGELEVPAGSVVEGDSARDQRLWQ